MPPVSAQEEQLLSAILDHIGPLIVLEPDGRIARFNRAAERLINRDASELTGRSLFEAGLGEVQQAFAVATSDERGERVLQWFDTPDGRRLVGWRGRAVYGRRGQGRCAVREGIHPTGG